MSALLRRYYRHGRLAWRFLTREELRSRSGVAPLRRLALLRQGFLSQAAELYNLTDYSLDDYFSDWAKARMSMMYDGRNVRAGYQYGLNNKLFSTAILGQHVRVPKLYASIEHGRIVPLDGSRGGRLGATWRDACAQRDGMLVFKPSAGSCGRGVFFLDAGDDSLRLNGQPVSEEDVDGFVRGWNEYIVCEFIRQGGYAAGLYPHATNTMRVVTIIDPSNQEPYMPIAVQRIGRDASKPVDNWFQSGLSAEIDVATGTLSRAASRERDPLRLVWYNEHPDTASRIQGVQVPNWSDIKRSLLDVAARLAYFKFLSWDVVALDDGFAVIEADTVSAIDLLQVHRPLLRDERLRRFFEYHGYVRPRRASAAASNGQVRPAT